MQEVAVNALKVMTDQLVAMENLGKSHSEMIVKCVWPIIGEADKKFTAIENEQEVNVSDFSSAFRK
jgi:hypothetical protein